MLVDALERYNLVRFKGYNPFLLDIINVKRTGQLNKEQGLMKEDLPSVFKYARTFFQMSLYDLCNQLFLSGLFFLVTIYAIFANTFNWFIILIITIALILGIAIIINSLTLFKIFLLSYKYYRVFKKENIEQLSQYQEALK